MFPPYFLSHETGTSIRRVPCPESRTIKPDSLRTGNYHPAATQTADAVCQDCRAAYGEIQPIHSGSGHLQIRQNALKRPQGIYTRERNDFLCLRGLFDTMQRQVSLTYY